jgi:hypothetical protein
VNSQLPLPYESSLTEIYRRLGTAASILKAEAAVGSTTAFFKLGKFLQR